MPGTYQFFLGSSQGATLTLNGNVVINNDGQCAHATVQRHCCLPLTLFLRGAGSHGFIELGSLPMQLAVGSLAVEVAFFQTTGPAGCTLRWLPPAATAVDFVPGRPSAAPTRSAVPTTQPSSPTSISSSVLRINCGGSNFTDPSTGLLWVDRGFVVGTFPNVRCGEGRSGL